MACTVAAAVAEEKAEKGLHFKKMVKACSNVGFGNLNDLAVPAEPSRAVAPRGDASPPVPTCTREEVGESVRV